MRNDQSSGSNRHTNRALRPALVVSTALLVLFGALSGSRAFDALRTRSEQAGSSAPGTAGSPATSGRPASRSGRYGSGGAVGSSPAANGGANAKHAGRGSWPGGCPLGLSSSTVQTTDNSPDFVRCSGTLDSFDSTPLQVTLSLPAGGEAVARPLVVMLHGWGDSEAQFQSTSFAGDGATTYDWNDDWFTAHGYGVLTYDARGFDLSCGKVPPTYTYATDPACSGKPGEQSWTHLADRRYEVHDTQYLVGLLVDAGAAQAQRIVVTGDSYGGGQSWELALSQDQVMEPDGSLVPWTSPHGVAIRLAAAVPQYPWTDLAQALVDNGRGSDGIGVPDGPHEIPVGVDKQSYVAGLYADGLTTAQYAAPGDPEADLTSWFAAVSAGEPYSADPVATNALAQIEAYRSPYAMVPSPSDTAAARRFSRDAVPVFDESGFTDPLFPSVQYLELAHEISAVDPSYPLWAFLGDIGHSYAANPHADWVTASAEANTFLADVVSTPGATPPHGARADLPAITVDSVACESSQHIVTTTASSWASLSGAGGALTLSGAGTANTSNPALDIEGPSVDPIVASEVTHTSGCPKVSPVAGTTPVTDPAAASWTWAVPASDAGRSILGAPVVHVDAMVTGTDAELSARLFDVDPTTGVKTLVTRSIYRITSSGPPSTEALAFELWPTYFEIPAGHELQLELTQVDSPTWRADNLPSTVTLSSLNLELPLGAPGA